jgi:hypothetical protein
VVEQEETDEPHQEADQAAGQPECQDRPVRVGGLCQVAPDDHGDRDYLEGEREMRLWWKYAVRPRLLQRAAATLEAVAWFHRDDPLAATQLVSLAAELKDVARTAKREERK